MLLPQQKDSKHFLDFWKNGNGKQLQDWSQAELSLDQFDNYSPFYYKTDELADAVVKDLYFNKNFHEAHSAFLNYIRNGVNYSDASIPTSIKELFKQTETLPDWLDKNKLKNGAELCRRSGLTSLMVLRDYSLMGGYDFSYLNKPLIFTGALKKGAVKRLADTLDFWVNVTHPDALHIHALGYEKALTTRIIHAYSRLMILEKRKDWDTKEWGLPINLLDMSATYLGFSLVFLHGLKKLGILFTQKEEDGHFHLWKYIGYLIGIPEYLLPDNKKQATELFYTWTSIQPPSDDDSRLLAKSLLQENLESHILKYQFQRKNLRYLHICMNWYLLDTKVNQRLAIPKVSFSNLFPKLIISQNKFIQKFFTRETQINKGGQAQDKVLEDYLKTSPRNIHN